jgi:hypothetical protein
MEDGEAGLTMGKEIILPAAVMQILRSEGNFISFIHFTNPASTGGYDFDPFRKKPIYKYLTFISSDFLGGIAIDFLL